jgi:protein-disulfide isomerase
MTAFNSCFKANKYRAEIQADFDSGNTAGVKGTPSIFVNGTFVAPGYVPSYDQVLQEVEAALAK